jgi:hypothetical protein
VLGDINTGSRFREAYNVLCTIPGLHVLCPLIFFIDKTHTDTFGNLCLDPVTFTLGIFKRHFWNQPKVWQTLGYITNQSHHGTKGKAKAVDLQAILKVIIEDIEGLNENGGVRWKFPYMGKDYDVVFKFTVLFISGNTEGHDKLAAHFLSRSNVQRPCRYCSVSFAGLADPHDSSWSYTKQSVVKDLVDRKDVQGLQAYSQQLVDVAFHSGLFHGCKFGLHGNTVPGFLHVWAHGLYLRYSPQKS